MAEQGDHNLIIETVKRHKDITEIQFVLDVPECFKIRPLSGGSSNMVLLVTSQDEKRKFVYKYAPSVIKNFTGTQLTPQRINIDYYSLLAFDQFYPSCVPHVYCMDDETHSICMEYMEGMDSLTLHHNIQNHVDLDVARKLGEIIATVHKNTWTKNMSSEEAQKMKDKFIIDDITEVKLEFDFIRGLDEDYEMKYIEPEALEAFRDLQKDGAMDRHREVIVDMVRNKQQCLVHNDYYPGSVMVKGQSVKVYDMEFASITAAGADSGLMAIFYVMGYVRSVIDSHPQIAAAYFAGTEAFLEAYMQTMGEILVREEHRKEMVEDTALFSGWFLISMTTFKDAHFHMTLTAQVKIVLWRIGRRLLDRATELTTMKDYLDLVQEACLEFTSA